MTDGRTILSAASERLIDLDPRPDHQWMVDPWAIEAMGVYTSEGGAMPVQTGPFVQEVDVPPAYAPFTQVAGVLWVWNELATPIEATARRHLERQLQALEVAATGTPVVVALDDKVRGD